MTATQPDTLPGAAGASVVLPGLAGAKVVLTGASGTIGRHVAQALSEAGAWVIGGGLTASEDVLDDLRERGFVRETVLGDLSDSEVMQELLDVSEEASVVINMVGSGVTERLDRTTDEDFAHMFEINVMLAARTTRHFVPKMAERGHGKVINVASVLAAHPVPAIAAYGASKAALVGFTRSVAIEYAARNVQVNAIAPAYVDGANKAEFFGYPGGLMFAHQFMPRQQPLPASAISGPVLFLASQLSDHVTGHVLTVDGGYTVW